MNFEELDATRFAMVHAFDEEEASGVPYRSRILSIDGLRAFPGLMRNALESGTEVDLSCALNEAAFWEERDAGGKRVNVRQRAEQLAATEFNTWYVRGLARRLLDEGESECEVYRAGQPRWEPSDCSTHEGRVVAVQAVYDGHRKRYWPEPGDKTVLSVPFEVGCHHSIRRISR